ncbi:GTP-binding protein [Couchioplanes caeruleus]|uniref:CobW C-terminal domain-containing protein n=2 Tax=Couchioplanes caeruleus TaxID=56438 RepID=A0A1K0GM88_9ACTN|nr:GTP-binding protein [Couchioplanes caeruleus]OJF12180.1 hypothetical protein BG844_22095 [Couchioplanes caeruleus subsp. caeruleus]ROP28257.1 cobalamin synthesis protein cobW-like protein [Couchioplanes caeruleus]
MTISVLGGFWPHATSEAASALLAKYPGLRLVRYESPRPGVLARTGAVEIPYGDDPAGALIRDLAAVVDGGKPSELIVVLPEAYEPDEIRTAWHAHTGGAPLSLTTVVPADLVMDGVADDTVLRAVDLHRTAADERSVGEVVCRQIEQADTVLFAGPPDGDDAWEAEQLRILLHRMAPWSQHRSLADLGLPAEGHSEPLAPLTRGLRGRTVGVHAPLPEHGVVAVVFHARRPLHPGRLHEALDEITDRVVRSRGHFWLASRPDLVMTWESAAGLSLGPTSGWLADLPDECWNDVDDERRLATEIDWDPYYGDRSQHLAFIGIDLDPVRLHRTLAGCLLTDDELSRGPDVWRRWADPFTRSYPAPPVTTTARPRDGL